MLIEPKGGGFRGLQERNIDVRVICRGGAGSRGEIWMFDRARSDADTTERGPGVNGDRCNVIAPTAGGLAAGYEFVILDEDIAENAEGKAWLTHKEFNGAKVKRGAGSGSVATGAALVPATDKTLDATLADGEPIVGIYTDATATINTAVGKVVSFNGLAFRTATVA